MFGENAISLAPARRAPINYKSKKISKREDFLKKEKMF